MIESKVFLITGVSSGLGKAFAQGALAAGHRVIGTLRSAEVSMSRLLDGVGIKLFDGVPGTGSRVL